MPLHVAVTFTLQGPEFTHAFAQDPAGFRTLRSFSFRTFAPGLSGADEGKGESPIQARTGVYLALRTSHSQVFGPFVFHLLTVHQDSVTERSHLCPHIPHCIIIRQRVIL